MWSPADKHRCPHELRDPRINGKKNVWLINWAVSFQKTTKHQTMKHQKQEIVWSYQGKQDKLKGSKQHHWFPAYYEFGEGVGKLKPGSVWDFFFGLWYGGWHEWQQKRVINPLSRTLTSKCFQPCTALLLRLVWHFSALPLWGCNINKASLKVHQLLKLSWSLPITVTMPCVLHKNMFSLHNSQQAQHWADS